MSLLPTLAYACVLVAPGPCGSGAHAPFADDYAIGDTALRHVSGKAAPPLTVGAVITIEGHRALADFHTFGSIGQAEMDIWWATTGASMIAESVRTNEGLR